MTLQEAIIKRHSVRKYLSKPLSEEVLMVLHNKIDECNRLGNLHIQLITHETKAFTGMLSYGKFFGVENYLVIVGEKADDLEERAGYYGELLVLRAQTLGLNTCWVGLSYRKTDAYQVSDKEKLVCMIAIGYGATQGVDHKRKTIDQINKNSSGTPDWYKKGLEAAILAPTAINQQKFSFEYIPADGNRLPQVKASKGFSLVGYTHIDLGIAKLHFEIGAGKENFEWTK